MHTFALGSDRDEEALHGISAATGDTFSLLSDALPPCIAGLRSVTARDVCIEVDCRCQYPEIGIAAIKSGRYKNIIKSVRYKNIIATPAMRKMEELWEMRKVAPAPAPRSRLEARLAAAAPRPRC